MRHLIYEGGQVPEFLFHGPGSRVIVEGEGRRYDSGEIELTGWRCDGFVMFEYLLWLEEELDGSGCLFYGVSVGGSTLIMGLYCCPLYVLCCSVLFW